VSRRATEAIAGPREVTPEWLSGVLARAPCLDRAQVLSVRRVKRTLEVEPWFADISFLRVCYLGDIPESAPRRLVLKVSKPGLSRADLAYGEREVNFYATIASRMDDLPLARCYDALYDPETGRSHILLDDLSETRFQPRPPLPPCGEHCGLIVDSLAHIHAFGRELDWNEMGPSVQPGADVSMEQLLRYPHTMAETAGMLPGFVDLLDDRLSAARRSLYERVLASWPFPNLQERLAARRGLTLVHGDAHAWNFLLPHDSTQGKAYIIDWHEWGFGLGTDDLAELMTLWWYPERRARFEELLLRRYHGRLLERGITGYDWQQCWEDYRLSVVKSFLSPVWMYAEGRAPAVWWPILERVVLAFQDLGCAELLS
jgi:hypothetical protein